MNIFYTLLHYYKNIFFFHLNHLNRSFESSRCMATYINRRLYHCFGKRWFVGHHFLQQRHSWCDASPWTTDESSWIFSWHGTKRIASSRFFRQCKVLYNEHRVYGNHCSDCYSDFFLLVDSSFNVLYGVVAFQQAQTFVYVQNRIIEKN